MSLIWCHAKMGASNWLKWAKVISGMQRYIKKWWWGRENPTGNVRHHQLPVYHPRTVNRQPNGPRRLEMQFRPNWFIRNYKEQLHEHGIFFDNGGRRIWVVPNFYHSSDGSEWRVHANSCSTFFASVLLREFGRARYTESDDVLMLVGTLMVSFRCSTPSVTFLLEIPA